ASSWAGCIASMLSAVRGYSDTCFAWALKMFLKRLVKISSSRPGAVRPRVGGRPRKAFQVLTGEVRQVRHTLTDSVMAPSQVNLALSYFWLGSNSGAIPAMRVKVPKVSPSLGAA